MAGASTMCSTGAVVCKAVRQCPSSAGISMRLLPGVGFRLRNSLRPRYLVTTPALRSAVVQAQYPGDGGGPGVDGYVNQAPPASAYQQQPFQQQQPPFQQQQPPPFQQQQPPFQQQQQQPFQQQQEQQQQPPFQQQQQPFQQQQQPFQQQQQPFQQQQDQQQQQPGNPSAGGQVDPNAEQLWRSLFSNPSQFWDDRSKKRFPSDPDFVKKGTRDKLWIESPTTPPWVQGQLSQLPAPVARPPRQFGNQGGYGNQGQGYQQGGGGGGGGQWANRQGDPNAPQENRPRPRYRETYRPQPKLTPEEEAAREERIRQILSHNPPEHRRLFTHKYFPDPFTGEYDPPDS